MGPKGGGEGPSDLVGIVLGASDPAQRQSRIERFIRTWCQELSVLHPDREVAAIHDSLVATPQYFHEWFYHECVLNIPLARLVGVTCNLIAQDSPLRNDPEMERLMQQCLTAEKFRSMLPTLRSTIATAWEQFPDPRTSFATEWPTIRERIKSLPVLVVENLRAKGLGDVTLFLLHRLGVTTRSYPGAD
ncbi:MAG: hypothetical protein HY696_04875 [Deltaproteobacteria bacterium]|nr:hypothetical protein [Deltaproteobacteria bacterium]